jgi:shikimate 5-dehydrogenase
MVYGGSHLNDVAKERECIIVKGKDMLIHQGIKAFELFTSVNVPYEMMRDAL